MFLCCKDRKCGCKLDEHCSEYEKKSPVVFFVLKE